MVLFDIGRFVSRSPGNNNSLCPVKVCRDLSSLTAWRDKVRILVKLATNNASKLAGDNASTCPLQKELQAES